MTNEEQLQHLHRLIAVAKDGELGYQTAAEHVNDPHLATIFAEYAKERGKFVRDLEAEVERINATAYPPDGRLWDETEASGTLSGSVFRGWIDVKSLVTGGGREAIAAACETGEDAAQAAYEKVVNTDVSGQTRALVEAQWGKIKEAHQRMVHLKAEV